MTFKELKTVAKDLHTGSLLPTQINIVTGLVLGKLARLRLNSRKKIHEITIGSDSEWVLATEIPDFLSLKSDQGNNGKSIYYYVGTEPCFLNMTNNSRFSQSQTIGGVATIIGGKLKVSFPTGTGDIGTLYVPYFSKYLVLDEDGTTEKFRPENDDDTFLIDEMYEDVLVEGILLYTKRRELSTNEFTKALREWENSVASLLYYQ